jgi:hypothetical protein
MKLPILTQLVDMGYIISNNVNVQALGYIILKMLFYF